MMLAHTQNNGSSTYTIESRLCLPAAGGTIPPSTILTETHDASITLQTDRRGARSSQALKTDSRRSRVVDNIMRILHQQGHPGKEQLPRAPPRQGKQPKLQRLLLLPLLLALLLVLTPAAAFLAPTYRGLGGRAAATSTRSMTTTRRHSSSLPQVRKSSRLTVRSKSIPQLHQ